ncbi:lanthionine synthetase LanC family protein [Olivibacter sp. 47]|uniref:lanthionine synthetase LanC family protein n=1 Tax=Olivibacter sp. 47 TaxID=3056486 RepID=UPI0025A3D452|nr:lanthionine synthetase LanC family protein [Olivibacter sp. 47]MDM8173473.1 lanthionine synthetase LanC family protein [Olivibacter sp. 47]
MLQISKEISHIIPYINFDVNIDNCSILTGELSKVLVLFSLYDIGKDETVKVQAEDLLYKHVELAANYTLNFKFAYGLTGLTWLIRFLKNRKLLNDDYDDFLIDVDANLYKSLKWDLEDKIYDPFIGFIGKAQYLFERLESGTDDKVLDLLKGLIDGLDESCIKDGENISWLDFYTSLHNPDGDKNPYFNVGLAHGVPSIICFLSKCVRKKIEVEKCSEMIKGAVRWLLNQGDNDYVFPSVVWPDKRKFVRHPYVLSWCYGILSVATACFAAAKELNDDNLRKEAKDMVKIASGLHKKGYAVVSDEAGIPNLFFCHGSYGIAFILNKFGKIFNDDEIFEAYRYWINFSEEQFGKYANLITRHQGLLEGLSGIALIDLNLKYPDNSLSNWDKIFFLDLLD